MNRRRLVTGLVAACLLSIAPARGAFTTIVNAPPDVIPPGASFGANTQINLYPGFPKTIGQVFHLGDLNVPADDAQLNVVGGSAWSVEAWTGSQLNIMAGSVNGANLLGGRGTMSGGTVKAWALFGVSHLEMSGGTAAQVITAGSVDDPARNTSTFLMTGGGVGVLDATGNATIQGGTVGTFFFRGAGLVDISGGSIGDDFEVGSVVTGALPEDPTRELVVGSGGHVTVRGGSIGQRMILRDGRTLDYSGGTIGNAFQALEGSRVNIRGSRFFVDGAELTWPAGKNLILTDRDVTLEGLLADGQSFHFDLNSEPGHGDYFSPQATVVIMLVPEPATLVTLLVAISTMTLCRRAG